MPEELQSEGPIGPDKSPREALDTKNPRLQTPRPRKESADRRLERPTLASYIDTEFRLATLNLMEDAQEAAAKREKAEGALKQNQEQFRRTTEDAPIPVIIHAEGGEVLELNRTWTDLTGFSIDTLPRLDLWLNQAFGPHAEAVRQAIAAPHPHGGLTQLELEVFTRTGEKRYWIFTNSWLGTLPDGRRFAVGMALDITERKQAEEAMRGSEERLRLLIENVREYAIFSMDRSRKVTSWNTGAEHILGYSENEIVGQSGDCIFTEEDRAAGGCEQEASTALREGRAADERWHQRKDGSRFWSSGVMMAMSNADGMIVGFVKVLRDETEAKQHEELLASSHKRLEQALAETERARAEAEKANQSKDVFLARLSHELRAPLAPVLITAETLLRRPDLPPRVREGLELIIRNVELEAHFINDLLDLTHISRGRFELLREPVDLHEIIRAALQTCETDFRRKGQSVSLDLRARRSVVSGDKAKLQQVFWNLLINAAKFTHAQGRIQITSMERDDSIVVQVSDNGIGLDPSQLENIFQPFRQADETVSKQYGGLGLGLSIAKSTVETLGGQISAESAGPGQGSTFTVLLPLTDQ